MADEILAQYSFVPWLRRGIATQIEEADDLGASTGVVLRRAQLPVTLELDYAPISGPLPATRPAISKSVQVLGPGDVVGVRSEAILRTRPSADERNFEANGLAFIEFYEEDFAWRYTPARPARPGEPADRQHKLRPWLALWVLKREEFSLGDPHPERLPTIKLTAQSVANALPPHNETWAWAHVQISRVLSSPGEIDLAINKDPDHALCRLICPRRLESDTSYQAFLVPAFEAGRLTGLGEDATKVVAQAPSWRTGVMPHSPVRPYEYPIYYSWSFQTGQHGDFESLVRALKPGPVGPRFGKRDADLRDPGYGMAGASPTSPTTAIEGALRPPDFSSTPFPTAPGIKFVTRMESLLDAGEELSQGHPITLTGHPYRGSGANGTYGATLPEDPIVLPPTYGKWHADVQRLASTRSIASLAWLRELNLDPRARAAAGLGAEVVQGRQEELVERAWQQVGQLEAANVRLRHAELALSVSQALFAKHVEAADSDRMLRLTAAAHGRMLGTSTAKTVRAEIQQSQVPIAAQTAAFKRITRPQRGIIRRLAGSASHDGFHRDLLAHFNREIAPVSAAPPRAEPVMSLAFSVISQAVQASVAAIAAHGDQPHLIFMRLVASDLTTRRKKGEDLKKLALVDFRTNLMASLDLAIPNGSPAAQMGMKSVVSSLIKGIRQVQPDTGGTIQVVVPVDLFISAFSNAISGKSLQGVTVVREGLAPGAPIARMTSEGEVRTFQADLADFNQQEMKERQNPLPPPPISAMSTLATRVLDSMRPDRALLKRVSATLLGVDLPKDGQPRRLRSVMAHPVFPDPMFEDLRSRSQDFVIPNYSELPQDTLTLLESNQRFIEAYMAGLNHELASELLWREYPTDLRGTYFRSFWDTHDNILGQAIPDIKPLHKWSGPLGGQSERTTGYLVLVIRGELFRKYPSTVVYAQRAVFDSANLSGPRLLSSESVPANLCFPVFHGALKPDINIFGFPLTKEQARGRRPSAGNPGDPGWFFVLRERPGETDFGLDDPIGGQVPPLKSWNDLNWGHLKFLAASPGHISIAANHLTLTGTAGPSEPTQAIWGANAADVAYIFFQNPVHYARHAQELLP